MKNPYADTAWDTSAAGDHKHAQEEHEIAGGWFKEEAKKAKAAGNTNKALDLYEHGDIHDTVAKWHGKQMEAPKVAPAAPKTAPGPKTTQGIEDNPLSRKAVHIAGVIGQAGGKTAEAHRASMVAKDAAGHAKAAKAHRLAAKWADGIPSLPQYAGNTNGMSRERAQRYFDLASAHRDAAKFHEAENLRMASEAGKARTAKEAAEDSKPAPEAANKKDQEQVWADALGDAAPHTSKVMRLASEIGQSGITPENHPRWGELEQLKRAAYDAHVKESKKAKASGDEKRAGLHDRWAQSFKPGK